MSSGTPAVTRPDVPYEAPEGRQWVPEELSASVVRPAPPGRTCRWRGSLDERACGAEAVVSRRRGVSRISWWDYCADPAHSDGVWAEDGRVYRWKLEDLPGSDQQ